jgi:hypothetical protein
MKMWVSVAVFVLAGAVCFAGDVKFKSKPAVAKKGDAVEIVFAVSDKTDVEVAVLGVDGPSTGSGQGRIVRHLAAGVLGGENPPPPPLQPGLEQKLTWDGKDDLGKPVAPEGCKVRIRLGTGVKFGGFIGADPFNFGKIIGSAADEDGNLYVLGFNGQLNHAQMDLRVFDKDGNYLREIMPFPANLPDGAMKKSGTWDEERKAWQPRQRNGLNPDFYNGTKNAFNILSASKEGGLVLRSSRGQGAAIQTLVLELDGSVRGYNAPEAGAAKPADANVIAAIQAKGAAKSGLPIDWSRLVVDYDTDDVYVNDGCSRFWKFNGKTGEGGLLKRKNGQVFGATDFGIGYDGLLYVRTARGAADGCDYSGAFERFTRNLEPAPYPGGTHVLSKYIYSRYGIGYAERGIGVAPDGTVYISFMHDWGKYSMAGFGPDGKPLKGKYMEGKIGNKGNPKTGYPDDLTSAIIGPIPQANGGIRVDRQGNIYVGMLFLPKGFKVPAGQDKMVWNFMVGGVLKFSKEGGCVKGDDGMMRGDEAEGMLAFYPGLAPFSSAGFTCNPCCVCRGPRWDLDRYGRIVMPNGVSNTTRLVDNAGNLIVQFGKYGNFDSLYVNPNTEQGKKGKPTVECDDIPMGWPSGAGFGPGRLYILDSYTRRVIRVELTSQVEETVPLT